MPISPVTDDDLAGQPPPFQAMRIHNSQVDHDSVHLLDPTPEQRHRQRLLLANVTMIDHRSARSLQTLDDRGYLDNAVVIFTSDHGGSAGDHGHSQKWTMYDIITRMPLVVWSPGRFDGGRTVDDLCQLMDIGPTILDLAGVPVPESMEAQSLLPALAGISWEQTTLRLRRAQPRRHPQGDRIHDHGAQPHVEAGPLPGRATGQLFDLINDPDEMHNLWDDPAYADKRLELLDVPARVAHS
ncbi:MAG: sulfatase-like hydrolase/transferase [Caldilineaceae bacterium]